MFGWITRLFTRRKRRNIFRFFNGTWYQAVDPIEAWQSLNTDPEWSMEKHLNGIDAGDIESAAITARATRRAFGIRELAQGGLTNEECLEVLMQFFNFAGDVKKKHDGKPTSQSPTESASSVVSPTSFDSVCGSIEVEPTNVVQSR